LILAPVGDLDMATAQKLDARLVAAAREHREGRLIVDLAGIDFMDSAGLRVLPTAARSAGSDGDRLRLRRRARPSVQRVRGLEPSRCCPRVASPAVWPRGSSSSTVASERSDPEGVDAIPPPGYRACPQRRSLPT
jgi:anti-anti-sigma factor